MSCLKVQVIDSGIRQIFILIHFVFSIQVVSLMMFCVRLVSGLMVLLSTHLAKDQTCCHRLILSLSCNLILQIKMLETGSIFYQLLFDFEVPRFGT